MSGEIYRARNRFLHLFGIHQRMTTYSISPRCDWCGHQTPKQRAIAAANWHALQPTTDPRRTDAATTNGSPE